MRILMSGATGLIGKALGERLVASGHQCWGLSRSARPADARFERYFAWDTLGGPLPDAALEGVDAVIHLAGEPVAEGRWNPEKKRRIRESRTQGTAAVVDAIARAQVKPQVLLAASAVGYYGDRGSTVLREDERPGSSFLAEVCVAWEQQSAKASALGVRVVQHRIGIVLARQGGALPKMAAPFRLGVGGKLGTGAQYVPWIHLDDAVGLLAFALETATVQGPVNTVAPHEVTNAEFTATLGHTLHRPTFATVPAFALRLALGEMADATLESQRVTAEKAIALGYVFRYPTLGPALQALLG